MPTFTSPLRTDWTFAQGQNLDPAERRFWSHFGAQPRGRTLIKTSGTWAAYDFPTNDQITAADNMTDTNGYTVKAVLYGGHVTPITVATSVELTAAGFGAFITA